MVRNLVLAALVVLPAAAARANAVDGVSMPEVRVVDGTRLRLNGVGLRTYSLLRIHIYVAGLYLEQPTRDSDSILHSPEHKLLDIRFVRDVNAEDARSAWRDGLASNCRPPACTLDPRDVERFLAAVPPIRKGDETTMLFSPHGVHVTFNERPLGDISDAHFAETLLATFIGPVPPTPHLKRALLGAQE